MKIRYQGRHYELTRHKIENVMQGVVPEIGRRYFIEVNHTQYPIKQVFAVALGIPVASFPTGYAFNVLQRLGFIVIDAQGGDRDA